MDKLAFTVRKEDMKAHQPLLFIASLIRTLIRLDKRLKRQQLRDGKERAEKMKYLVALFLLAQLAIYARYTEAQVVSWESSPLNYQNSPLNYDNSSLNYQNSPLNYQNSPLNYNSTNGLYDNNGNRIGYETKTPSGVTNYFDNNGNRIGYSPANKGR